MVTANKKTLSIIAVLSIICIAVPSKAVVDNGTMIRKGLGLVGAGIVVNGLWKIISLRPSLGVCHVTGGLVISLGGICSDIIFNKIVRVIRKLRLYLDRKQNPRQGFWESFQDVVEDVGNGVQDVHEGVAKTLGNAARAEVQIETGWHTFKYGNPISGLNQMYDGLYHNIRARCRIALNPKIWQKQ